MVKTVGMIVTSCLTLAACTTQHHPTASSARAKPAASTVKSVPLALVPSYPTGQTTCGDYGISATTFQGTVGLLSCAGLAGRTDAKPITIGVGGEIFISGLPAKASLTISPANIVELRGTTLTAVHSGDAVVTAHDVLCVPLATGVQPKSCKLAHVIIQ